MKKFTAVTLSVFLPILTSQAANIAWISFHSGDNSPSAGAAGAGFTQAPDIGYTSLLSANGYNVTRLLTTDNVTNTSFLSGYDLVIIGRGVDSSHYRDAAEVTAWNSYTGKILDMGAYTLRGSNSPAGSPGNARLGWYTGQVIPDTTSTVTLKPTEYHPIFAGIPLDGASGNMFNAFANIVTYTPTNGIPVTARGISVITSPLAGNGTVLATFGTATDPSFGAAAISLWSPGSTTDRGDVFGGYRMAFLSGSREASGVSSQTAGVFDLTADGAKLFLNTVDYFITVVPEPSSAVLIIFGSLALFIRRKST